MAELSKEPLGALVQEILNRREELLTPDGFLEGPAFNLADFLGIRVCVDGVPARQNQQSETELMAIRRNSGPYTGKLCLIGGGIGRVKDGDQWMPESFEEALRRHFANDLGYTIEPLSSWQKPQYMAQDMRPLNGEVKEQFTPNANSRHLVAARFLVRVTNDNEAPVFGSTELGGQEASDIAWFTQATMPPLTEFGYEHGETYRTLFPIADKLLRYEAQ